MLGKDDAGAQTRYVETLDTLIAETPRSESCGADLRGKDFRRANLREAKLSQARLSGADLGGAGAAVPLALLAEHPAPLPLRHLRPLLVWASLGGAG